ncbi:HlyD family secretion protein [Microbulbifer thermotolerans]|uniref:HlyD family secretion protein n=1 Tax=Microbulbifer thermotolerans TaxID=252514 RepID=UPI002249819B|nr:HlyD family secretion protein [Microbulbifer thermotolerans]MCX2794192.1 HlyD family secretion protein [Microbulbifer thermotolerans]
MKKNRIVLAGGALLVIAVAAIILIGVGSGGVQATDNAYIKADMTAVAPQISGVIRKVAVRDYQPVQKGDLLFTIDDRELNAALRQAEADVASAEADIHRIQVLLDAHKNRIRQAQAVLKVDEANLQLARANQKRFRSLAQEGSGTEQDQEQADAVLAVQQATFKRDEEALQAAHKQEKVLQSQLDMARAALTAAQARRDRAQLQLSYTQVRAPVSGVVAQRLPREGSYVHAGQTQITLVPLNTLYIEANYRETQLADVKAGQPVNFRVDALPGLEFRGHVESLGPASGVSFSPVAPHNATGNFTKIVQRLPVRIRIDDGQPQAARLRVGMSVRPEIHTDQ